jgi:hypothetical protein
MQNLGTSADGHSFSDIHKHHGPENTFSGFAGLMEIDGFIRIDIQADRQIAPLAYRERFSRIEIDFPAREFDVKAGARGGHAWFRCDFDVAYLEPDLGILSRGNIPLYFEQIVLILIFKEIHSEPGGRLENDYRRAVINRYEGNLVNPDPDVLIFVSRAVGKED